MPRVHHVKKARKDNPCCKKGEAYYWWKFRYGGKRYSKTYPKPSQLTQSEFYGTLYELQEQRDDACAAASDVDTSDQLEEFKTALEDIAQQLEDLGQECEDKRYNMPDSLQDSETGQLLETRSERCQEMATELQDALNNVDEDLFDEIDQDEPVEVKCPECGETMEVEIDACEAECEDSECGEKFVVDNTAEQTRREKKEAERVQQLADMLQEAVANAEGVDLDCE